MDVTEQHQSSFPPPGPSARPLGSVGPAERPIPTPVLPPNQARPAPVVDRRVHGAPRRRRRGPSMFNSASRRRSRVYVIVAILFLGASAIGWFAFNEYIYGDDPAVTETP